MFSNAGKKLFVILSILLSCNACGLQEVDWNSGQVAKMALLLEETGMISKEDGFADQTVLEGKESIDADVKNETDTTNRHAFTLGNNLVFTADMPENWRYVFYPVYDLYISASMSGS